MLSDALFYFQLLNKGIFLISMMGNRGTFNKPWSYVITDFGFVYHVTHLILCVLGLCVHEFFYSLLVNEVSYFWSCINL